MIPKNVETIGTRRFYQTPHDACDTWLKARPSHARLVDGLMPAYIPAYTGPPRSRAECRSLVGPLRCNALFGRRLRLVAQRSYGTVTRRRARYAENCHHRRSLPPRTCSVIIIR